MTREITAAEYQAQYAPTAGKRGRARKSELEEALARNMAWVGLPAPVREFHFEWCCEHRKREHKTEAISVPGGRHKIEAWCDGCEGLDVLEHEYKHGRDWRADFAWPALRLLVECEGGTADPKNPGRHVRPEGFDRDTEKYNAASRQGWTLLRFTRRQITSGAALEEIGRAIRTLEEGIPQWGSGTDYGRRQAEHDARVREAHARAAALDRGVR